MYGKSYDGVTGLIGQVSKPKGLSAVVSQEPVYDLYRYLYTNGVRYENSLATPLLYDSIAGTPGTAMDDPSYNQNAVNDFSRPGCPVLNWADQQNPDHGSPYWTSRNFINRAKGATIPLILTQGFLENNTKPDGAYDYFNNVAGYKRAWFGMWDHVRGNDTDPDTGRLLMGRAGWFDEVMRFYDRFVKGLSASQAPTDKDPKIAVETSDGTWRAETSWPPSDSKLYTSTLRPGTYVDNGQNDGELADANTGLEPTGDGVWTFSKPLPYAAHLSGIPKVTLDVTAQVGNGNLVADVYDVDAANNATLISRNAFLLGGARQTVSFPLYGDDWKLGAGHRIGVLVTSSNADWWAHVPTAQTITVNGGSISLPFLATARTKTIQGGPSVRLDYYKANAPFAVDPATIAAATSPTFVLPPKQK
jgi:predicted acyl esterase